MSQWIASGTNYLTRGSEDRRRSTAPCWSSAAPRNKDICRPLAEPDPCLCRTSCALPCLLLRVHCCTCVSRTLRTFAAGPVLRRGFPLGFRVPIFCHLVSAFSSDLIHIWKQQESDIIVLLSRVQRIAGSNRTRRGKRCFCLTADRGINAKRKRKNPRTASQDCSRSNQVHNPDPRRHADVAGGRTQLAVLADRHTRLGRRLHHNFEDVSNSSWQ